MRTTHKPTFGESLQNLGDSLLMLSFRAIWWALLPALLLFFLMTERAFHELVRAYLFMLFGSAVLGLFMACIGWALRWSQGELR